MRIGIVDRVVRFLVVREHACEPSDKPLLGLCRGFRIPNLAAPVLMVDASLIMTISDLIRSSFHHGLPIMVDGVFALVVHAGAERA